MPEQPPRAVPLFERVERFLDAVIPPSEEVTNIVRRGEALLAAGDPEGAQRAAESALAAAPLFLRGAQLRADALFARGDAAHALGVLLDVARERALPGTTLARMCEFAAAVGDETRALEFATQARARSGEQDHRSAHALLSAARSLIQQNKHRTALHLARTATVIDPSVSGAWLLLARDALDRGDAAQSSRALARAAHKLDPAEGALNREAGELALALGELAIAARHLRRAWLVGQRDALAPLVLALWRAGDAQGLERAVHSSEDAFAQTARALIALGAGDPAARDTLAAVEGASLPDPLWPLALESALRAAPEVAERWAREAPTRPGAVSVRALGASREREAQGDLAGAMDALAPAFDDTRTAAIALERHRALLGESWTGRLDLMLEQLAASARGQPVLAPFEAELRARRRELDEPLRIALLGEFSAGKSTFLNALIGAAVSPMGVLPTTAHVHWLRHGERGARVVDGRGAAVVCTIDAAPAVVERARASGAGVDYVEVTWPAPRLARLELIDTPGFNAGDPAHERAVRSAFAMADVALWLFDARQAGKSSELSPLEEARAAGLPALGVLNKIDQARPDELAKLAASVREGFSSLAPLVMSVSAKEALAAQMTLASDAADEARKSEARVRLASSGFASLLAWMDEHLVAQRAGWKQQRVARRCAALLAEAERSLDAEERESQRRDERRDALFSMIGALREQLPAVLDAARGEVARVLRAQLKGLDRRDRDGGSDAATLVADAAAEVSWRVRERVLLELRPGLTALERLAVDAGIVREESAALTTTPVWFAVDRAVADGARDAFAGPTPVAIAPGDPFAALEQAILRMDRRDATRDRRVRVALSVARRLLEDYPAPAIPYTS